MVVAAVALERLDVQDVVIDRLDLESFVPQVGQGALAVEVRDDHDDLIELVGQINHRQTEVAVSAERSFPGRARRRLPAPGWRPCRCHR